jgi:hypothetical protein
LLSFDRVVGLVVFATRFTFLVRQLDSHGYPITHSLAFCYVPLKYNSLRAHLMMSFGPLDVFRIMTRFVQNVTHSSYEAKPKEPQYRCSLFRMFSSPHPLQTLRTEPTPDLGSQMSSFTFFAVVLADKFRSHCPCFKTFSGLTLHLLM